MINTKNLDLRELAPFERHEKIFEIWNELKDGEILRITNDHEPKPLYYLFQAEHAGQFEWEYEKEGPTEWIFKMTKISTSNKREKIKNILKDLQENDVSDETKEDAKTTLREISPTELALAEQEIIKEGGTRKEIRKLCNIHLEIMRENLKNKDLNLKPGHPIHTLMAEHKEILGFINKLKTTINKLGFAKDFEDAEAEIKMLSAIVKHLVEIDRHYQREEDVLFSEMEKSGIIEPTEIMREEHIELKSKKKELYEIINNHKKLSYPEFLEKVREMGNFIIKELPDHIYKEDSILYPMALEVIKDEKKWEKIKEDCDEIGYCCFTPKY